MTLRIGQLTLPLKFRLQGQISIFMSFNYIIFFILILVSHLHYNYGSSVHQLLLTLQIVNHDPIIKL